ncbi:MAG TPA: hypothetical protein VER35_02500 [Candidatus Limnocylindrales bacterium]|nr:hypothetical protein [Candidatus Limnocylindrales bacterium]
MEEKKSKPTSASDDDSYEDGVSRKRQNNSKIYTSMSQNHSNSVLSSDRAPRGYKKCMFSLLTIQFFFAFICFLIPALPRINKVAKTKEEKAKFKFEAAKYASINGVKATLKNKKFRGVNERTLYDWKREFKTTGIIGIDKRGGDSFFYLFFYLHSFKS